MCVCVSVKVCQCVFQALNAPEEDKPKQMLMPTEDSNSVICVCESVKGKRQSVRSIYIRTRLATVPSALHIKVICKTETLHFLMLSERQSSV